MATRKQKQAVKILAENGGIAVSRAMEMAGYSPMTAQDPKKLTDSDGFAELLAEYLPDQDLASVHRRGLEAVKVTRDKFGEKYEDPDYYARHAYLETAYKIKGRLNPIRSQEVGDITINLSVYGKQDDRHSVSIHPKTVSATVSRSNGRGIQEGSDSLASQKRQRQDSSTSGNKENVA